jgi:hypothetical protein
MTAIIFHTPVHTSDGQWVGLAHRLHRRGEESADISTEPYQTYLEVVNQEIGDTLFLPCPFLQGPDEQGRVNIALTWNEVQNRTLFRTPRFIAYRQNVVEELPRHA